MTTKETFLELVNDLKIDIAIKDFPPLQSVGQVVAQDPLEFIEMSIFLDSLVNLLVIIKCQSIDGTQISI